MKKYFLTLATLLIWFFSFLIFSNIRIVNIPSSNDGGDFMVKERYEYESMMLRDPATGKIPYDIRRSEIEFAKNLPGSYYSKNKHNSIQTADWQRRGPYFVGGRTRALAIDSRDNNIILAGGVSGGMWRSVDAGQTWTKTTRPGQLHSVSCLVQDTRDGKENIWYAGTGEFWGNSARIYGDGIYKSDDHGQSWELIPSTSTGEPQHYDNWFEFVWRIVINPTAPADSDEIYAACAFGGIYRSLDGGESWEAVLGGFGNRSSFFTDIAVTSDGIFYATLGQSTFDDESAGTKGIFRSTDGENWTDISPDFLPEKFQRIVIGIAPSDESQVYFVAETPGAGKLTTNSRRDSLWHSIWKYTYVSGDGSGEGGIWDDRSQYVPKPEKVRGHMNSQSSYNLVCAVKPDDPNVVIVGGTNLYRSDDGFTSDNFNWIGGTCPDPDEECWYHYRYPNQHADQHAITFLPSDPNVMFTGTDGGVHKTIDLMADRVEWISLNNGFHTTQFYSCAVDHAEGGTNEILGGLQDNGTLYTYSDDIMTPWTIPSNGDGLSCAIRDGGQIYYTSQNSSSSPVAVKLWRILLDNEGEKLMKTRIDPAGGRDFLWNCPIVLDPNSPDRMYVGGGKLVWRNNDLSQISFADSKDSTEVNWDSLSNTRISLGNPLYTKEKALMTALDVSTNPANTVYYGTSYGEVFRIDNAHEGDPMPVNITSQLMTQNAFCSCIKIDPADADKAIAVFSNYNINSLFYTSDRGETWVSIGGNLEEYPNGRGTGPACYWVEIVPLQGKNIYYVGTTTGLYSTAFLDGEYTVWRQEAPELIGNMVVRMIDARLSDNFVAVGTHGAGMFSGVVSSMPTAPQQPELLGPANRTGGVMETLTLSWKETPGAVFYKLELSGDQQFDSIIKTFDGLRETSVGVKSLEQGRKKIYWRVWAKNTAGYGEPSETWMFQTAAAPPELVYPPRGADSISINPEFTWSAAEGAQNYHFQLAPRIFFNDLLVDTVLSATSLKFSGLEYYRKYHWRISSIDEYGEGVFSDMSSFNTEKLVSVEENVSAAKFGIAYPNPAIRKTSVSLIVTKTGKADIRLYDAYGRFVKRIESGIFAPGKHQFDIDLNGLPSGNYYLRALGKGIYAEVSFISVK